MRTSTGPAISVMLRGCAGLSRLGHDGSGGQHLHARLADGDDVRAGAHLLQPIDEMGDIVVEAEAAVRGADIAGIVPVGDADIVLRQHGAHQAAQQSGEMPGQGRHHQHARLRTSTSFLKCRSVPNGVTASGSSVTATSRLPIRTVSMP